MRFLFLFCFSFIFLSSCKFYDVVLIDKTSPGFKIPYPIKDKSSCAVKIKIIETGQEIWTRDKYCGVFDNIGDTLVCCLRYTNGK